MKLKGEKERISHYFASLY